jgi:hypothetical protein
MAKRKLLSKEERIRIKNQRALDAEIAARRRGNRVDFTSYQAGKTKFLDKRVVIANCPQCGENGKLSDGSVWGESVVFVHRGTIKEESFKMTEFHVVNRRQLAA